MLKRLQAIFILLLPFYFVFLWSTGFIAAKCALPYIAPFYLLFIRISLTVVIFVLLFLFFRAQWLSIRQIDHQMVTSALVHRAYLGGVFAAIQRGNARRNYRCCHRAATGTDHCVRQSLAERTATSQTMAGTGIGRCHNSSLEYQPA